MWTQQTTLERAYRTQVPLRPRRLITRANLEHSGWTQNSRKLYGQESKPVIETGNRTGELWDVKEQVLNNEVWDKVWKNL